MSQLRKSSRTPSQLSSHTTNDRPAGVCECFERCLRGPINCRSQFACPNLESAKDFSRSRSVRIPESSCRLAESRQLASAKPERLIITGMPFPDLAGPEAHNWSDCAHKLKLRIGVPASHAGTRLLRNPPPGLRRPSRATIDLRVRLDSHAAAH
jgi:hypothetical protein